jgi:hypothetical protein
MAATRTAAPDASEGDAPGDGTTGTGAGPGEATGPDGPARGGHEGPSAEAPRRARRPDWASDHFWLAVGGALAVGFALRLAAGLTDNAPASDETAYLQSGMSLVDGDGFSRDGRPELHFPPLVPLVLGLAQKVVGDPHSASVVVTLVAGTITIVPLALLARRLAGPRVGARAGIAAAWIAAVLPGLATMPALRGTGSEAIYTLVVVAATWVALAAAARDGRARLALTATAGLLTGLAYLTRPEGLFLALPLGLAVLWPALRHVRWLRQLGPMRRLRRRWQRPEGTAGAGEGRRPVVALVGAAAAFGLPVVMCVAPYAAFLHTHTGEWSLTAKTRDVSLEAWHAVARADRLTRDSILYELDETGLRFEDEHTSLPDLARDDPAGYAAIVKTNLGELGTVAVGWSLVPLPVSALAIWGAWSRRRVGSTYVALAVGLLPVATAVAFFVQPRYLVSAVAMATALAGVGVAMVSRRWRWWVAVGAVAVALVPSIQGFDGNAGWGHPPDFTDQRRAGEWVAENTDPDDLVVTRSMVVDFYADRPTVALPYAELPQVLAYARHYGARYIVADSAHIRRFRPQLLMLLDEDELDGLRLVHEVHAEGRFAKVWELDPAPPSSDAQGPLLGFMGDG